jgi:hypothetical protein
MRPNPTGRPQRLAGAAGSRQSVACKVSDSISELAVALRRALAESGGGDGSSDGLHEAGSAAGPPSSVSSSSLSSSSSSSSVGPSRSVRLARRREFIDGDEDAAVAVEGGGISRSAMSITRLECQVSELVNSDTCPRPTTGTVLRRTLSGLTGRPGAGQHPPPPRKRSPLHGRRRI